MPTEQRPPVSRRKLGIFGVVALIAAGLIVATGIRARENSDSKLKEWTDDQAVPTVAVALPDAKALRATLDLPGRLEAYYRAPIFARVSGYLKSWTADIGEPLMSRPSLFSRPNSSLITQLAASLPSRALSASAASTVS